MLFMKMVRNFCILGGKVLKKREIRYHSYFGYSQFPLGYRLFESNEFIHRRRGLLRKDVKFSIKNQASFKKPGILY